MAPFSVMARPGRRGYDAGMRRLLGASMATTLVLVSACGGDDGGPVAAEAACEERATACVTGSPDAITGQCTLDEGRRDCIIAAESCEQVHACYMGPLPDGGSSTFCGSACDRCGLSCDAECDADDPCVLSAGTCDAVAACLDGE